MRTLTLSLLVFFFHLPVTAQTPDCEIIKNFTDVTFNGATVSETCSFILQINNARGTKHAEFEIPFSKELVLKNLVGQIETTNGEIIRNLKSKDIEYSNAFSHGTFYSDNKIARFKLIHNSFPYRIKYSYTYVKKQFISLTHWYPATNNKVPVREAKLVLRIPANCSLSIQQQRIDEPTKAQMEKETIYTWTTQNQIAPKHEKLAPPLVEFLPFVKVMPKEFIYRQKGTAENWTHYGNWLDEINLGLNDLPAAEKQKVHTLTDHLRSEREKTRVLYHYLQDQTRYINVSIEQGGMCPYPASYVSKNKYGDCKALSIYMKALLEEAGIYSIYTNVFAGDIPVGIKSGNPSQQFNHAFLCIPFSGDTVWLECTSSTMPFDQPSTFTQNRKVLLIEKNNSRLVRTPALNSADVKEQYSHHIEVDHEGIAHFRTTAILRGGAFEYLIGMDAQLDNRQKADVMDQLGIINGADITNSRIHNPHRDSAWVELELEGTINHLAEKVGNRHLVKPVHSLLWRLEKPEERTQPLVIPYPTHEQDTLNYIFPHPILSVSGIGPAHLESPYGNYSRSIVFDGKNLQIMRQLVINSGYYRLDEYEEIYQFIKEVTDLDNQKALITYN